VLKKYKAIWLLKKIERVEVSFTIEHLYEPDKIYTVKMTSSTNIGKLPFATS
jgi:hypothetical protein